MEKVVFTAGWEEFFAKYGLKSLDDFSNCTGERVNKNTKREVIKFTLRDVLVNKEFFMKRFFRPHIKDILFNLQNFGHICSMAQCEWENAQILLNNNVNTYRPICYGERKILGVETESFLVTQKLEGICLSDFIADNWHKFSGSDKEEVIVSLAGFIRRIHNANVSLPDLYVWHIFIKEDSAENEYDFAVIDLHRMKHNVKSENEKIKNLGRLDHSMTDKYFDDELRRLFIKSYADADWPGNIKALAEKVKNYSTKISERRNPKQY